MTAKEDDLIARLKAQVRSGQAPGGSRHKPVARPPVSQQEIQHAEMLLGFTLPPLLARIYLEVGNGGFGHGYGLFKLSDESPGYDFDTLVQNYQHMRAMTQEDIDTYWQDEGDKPALWPEQLLMICDWGCNMYSYVDCTTPECRILFSGGNPSHGQFAVEAPSLYQWLASWLDGTYQFDWSQTEHITFRS
jgi:hypothetical protein